MSNVNAGIEPSSISTVDVSLTGFKSCLQNLPHPSHLHTLAATILHDLKFQHSWTSLFIHTHSTLTDLPLPRPLISGLPPRRIYIHPDEQAEIIRLEHEAGESVPQYVEREWVLPSQIQEQWSLAKFAAIFDAIESGPPNFDDALTENPGITEWQGHNRKKRILLATLHDDSTVVYYIIHEGLVKPRQN